MPDIRDYAPRNANWYCIVVYRQDGNGKGSIEGRQEGYDKKKRKMGEGKKTEKEGIIDKTTERRT